MEIGSIVWIVLHSDLKSKVIKVSRKYQYYNIKNYILKYSCCLQVRPVCDTDGLKEECLLSIATKTIEHQQFIDTMGRLDHRFCYHLEYSIISSAAQQRIKHAPTDDDALFEIRHVN